MKVSKSPLVKFILHEALWKILFPILNRVHWSISYTIRETGRERRKLLRFAPETHTRSQNLHLGPQEGSAEGSKAQKPRSPRHGPARPDVYAQKTQRLQNASSAAHGISKAAEDKKWL